MATDTQENGSTSEMEGQEQQDQQQQTTSETEGNGQKQQVTIDDSTELPESHPLVKKLGIQKGEISSLKTELTEARAQAARTTQLEEDLGKRPTTEAMETLQTRYDRLEQFAQAVGLGRALDSRTFTRDLFESDKDIKELVKDWNRANPSATSEALGNAPAGDGKSKPTPNELIRIAAGK